MNKEIKNNECKTICARCGGECCLRMPGAYFPEQLGLKEGQDENNAEILAALFNPEEGAPAYKLEFNLGKPSDVDFLTGDQIKVDFDAEDWCENPVIIPAPSKQKEPGYVYSGIQMVSYRCPYFTDGKGCTLCWKDRPGMCKALKPIEEVTSIGRVKYQCVTEVTLRELSQIWDPFKEILNHLDCLLGADEKIWKFFFGDQKNITSEMILNSLRSGENIISRYYRQKEEKSRLKERRENKRIKQESNPLFVALKNAGF